MNVVAGHPIVDRTYECDDCQYRHTYPVSTLMRPGRAICMECGGRAHVQLTIDSDTH